MRAEQERECEEFEDEDDNGEKPSVEKREEEKEQDEIDKKLRMAEFARVMKVRLAIAN